MESFIVQQLQHFLDVGARTFSGWMLACMVAVFAVLLLLLCARVWRMSRVLRVMRNSFSEAGMQSSPVLHESWHEYSATFVHDLQQNNKTPRDAAEFFTLEDIGAKALDMRWWRLAPHLFLVWGLGAVFAQLIHGLVFFDLSSPDAIMLSIERTFMAIAGGFALLFCGLVLSLCLHIALRQAWSLLARRTAELVAMLNRRYRITALEERELTLAEYAKTLTRIVSTLFADVPSGRSLTPGALSKALLEQVRKTNTLLEGSSPHIDASRMEELGRTAGKAMAEELLPLVARLEEAVRLYTGARAPQQEDVLSIAASLQASSHALQHYLHLRHEEEQHEEDLAEPLTRHGEPKQ